MAKRDVLLKILELARWAPSGDNTQPWRFEIVSDDHIAIHGSDTRDWCVRFRRSCESHGSRRIARNAANRGKRIRFARAMDVTDELSQRSAYL